MSLPSRNKPLIICAAFATSIVLAGAAALFDVLVPTASLAGFFMRTLPLAVVIPFVLFAFNSLCDRFEGRSDHERSETTLKRQIRSDHSDSQREPAGTDPRMSPAKSPNRRQLNENASTPIIVPVVVRERIFRTIVPGKKWWVGQ